MKKSMVMFLSLIVSIFFIGCGDESSTTCRIDVQKAIDEGNYDTAIDKLNGGCGGSYSASDLNYNLGVAYMGKSGFGVSEVINMILKSDEDDEAFNGFTRSVSKNSKSGSIASLIKAKDYLLASANFNSSQCSSVGGGDDERVLNACFYVGFSGTLLTANTITKLTKNIDGLLDAIDDNKSQDVPLDMNATLNALDWASDGNTSTPPTKIIPVTINGTNYQHLEVHGGGKVFYRLADKDAPDSNSSTILTDGYCDVNGSKDPCNGIENPDGSIDTSATNAGSCYACPVMLDDEAITTTQALVDSLNSGFDSITAVTSVTDDSEVQKSVDEYKEEIDKDGSGQISTQEIIKYLNAQ